MHNLRVRLQDSVQCETKKNNNNNNLNNFKNIIFSCSFRKQVMTERLKLQKYLNGTSLHVMPVLRFFKLGVKTPRYKCLNQSKSSGMNLLLFEGLPYE